jgi:hypothetical protein
MDEAIRQLRGEASVGDIRHPPVAVAPPSAPVTLT